MFESLVRPPWMVNALASRRLLVPPTSCVCALMPVLVERPGMRIARLWWLRPTGMASMTSFCITAAWWRSARRRSATRR